jgi:integrase
VLDPKRHSRRWVGLTREAGEAILASAERSARMAAERADWGPEWEGYVLRRPSDGAPPPVDEIGTLWGERLKGAGLPHWSFHSTRHFAASVWIAAGHPTWIVARRLGHKDTALVERTARHTGRASPLRRSKREQPPRELTSTRARDTVEGTDERHLSLYLPGMTEPGA